MARLTIGEAAALLHTSPSTIRSWEQRLGYPIPARTDSGRRLYEEDEIVLLADALARGLRISSAIRQIREETGSHETLLRLALEAMDYDACDMLLEAAISQRGVSRAFDEAVLVAIEELAGGGCDATVLALAIEWSKDRAGWSRRRAATPATHTAVIVDASPEVSITRVASSVLQLQLVLRSASTHVLVGPAIGAYRTAARRMSADAVVLVGEGSVAACRANGVAPGRVASFRADVELPPAHVMALPPQPRAAVARLLEWVLATDAPAV